MYVQLYSQTFIHLFICTSMHQYNYTSIELNSSIIAFMSFHTNWAELIQYCIALAEKIKRNGPLAIAAAIKSVNANYEEGINGFDIEIQEFARCFGTNDFKEGTSAFFEKRKAKFKGI